METVEKTKSKIGIVSFVLGIIGLMAGALPIIGAFVTIAGLVLGIKGHSTTHKKLAIAGIFLCVVGLFEIVVNGAVSYKGTTTTLFNSGTNTANINISNVENKSTQTVKKIIFCESIDNDLNATNVGDTFSVDSQFYTKFDNKAPFKTSKLKVTIYTMNGGSQSVFYTEEQDVEQDYTALAIPLNISTAGKYKIIITRSSDNQKLGEGEVTVVFYN